MHSNFYARLGILKIYTQKDCDLSLICSKKVAIIGFGSQGRAHALNLRDSGVDVLIGLYEGSKSSKIAQDLGFTTLEVAQAVQQAQVIAFMLPDELHAEVFDLHIAPFLQDFHTLVFCHGFSVHFGLIKAPKHVGVIMVAPKGQGNGVRDAFVQGGGIPDLIAVAQENQEHNAKALALSYACGIGGGRSFILETSFKDETETDLFGEQAVLCGGLKALAQNAFETLIEAGYPQELAYFECIHELKLVADLIYQQGILGMHHHISNTAEYGMITSGNRLINQESKAIMKDILKEIQDGSFARNFMQEKQKGYPCIKEQRNQTKEHPMEQVGMIIRNHIKQSQK